MSRLKQIPRFMQDYLKEAAVDPGLLHPTMFWELPKALDATDYYKMQPGIAKGSWRCEDDALWQPTSDGLCQKITKTYASRCRIDSSCPLFYYEVHVTKLAAVRIAQTRITVGMVWSDQGRKKVSYHYGDFVKQSTGVVNLASGDIIGCGISRTQNTIFYTKNGICIGLSEYPMCHNLELELRPLVCVAVIPVSSNPCPQPLVNTIYNFGGTKFAFGIARFAVPYWQERRKRFCQQAATLPGEVVSMITAVLAQEGYFPYASSLQLWARLSSVCRTWSNIFRPLMFQLVVLEKMSHYHHFRDALDSSIDGFTGRLISELEIQPVRHRYRHSITPGSCRNYTSPGLPFVLASLSWQLQKVTSLKWVAHGPQHHAPPRVQSALPALLHPLYNLRWLEIIKWTCDSLPQFFHVIRAIPGLEILRMTYVSIKHKSSQPLWWPASLTNSPPHLIEINRCDMSSTALSAFLKLSLCGRPDLLPDSNRSPISSWSVARAIHLDDAAAVVDMHETLMQHWEHDICTFPVSLEVDNLSEMAVDIIITSGEHPWCHSKLQMHIPDNGDIRLERMELELELWPERVLKRKATLNKLDKSLWVSSRRSQPPLRFPVVLRAHADRKNTKKLLSELMPKLHCAGRVSVAEVDPPLLKSVWDPTLCI